MNRVIVIRFIISFLFVSYVQIAVAEEPTVKWGLGTRSCAKFAQDFKSDPRLWETMYYIWAEGFMSGFNLVQIAQTNKLIDLNPHKRDEKWRRESIRNYCAKNPLAPYSEAVMNLIKELREPTVK